MNWSRTRSIARKEVRHILRDPFTMLMAIGLPFLFVGFFGYAIDFNVREIRLAVQDNDQTRMSRELQRIFSSASYFTVIPVPASVTPFQIIDSEKARAVLVIEPRFQRDLGAGRPVTVQAAIDGADNSTAGVILSYLGGIERAAAARLTGVPRRDPIEMKTRYLFNPELNSRWFTIPGLAVVIVAILAILLTTLTVAREWELGSMELLLSTPVEPLEIILGKLAPYVVLGLSALGIVYFLARAGFGVPFVGSHLLFGFATMLFLAAMLAQGLLISVTTRQQQIALQIAIMSGMLPNFLLNGFIFSIESMPPLFQALTVALPARWFMVISRGVFLKGAGWGELARPLLALAVISTILIFAAAKKFKRDLE